MRIYNTNRTGMSYDKLNRLKTTTYADSSTTGNSYDNLTNILRYTDEEGKITTNTYDKENRLLTTTLAGETVANAYDEVGNLISVTRPKGNRKAMGYDLFHRLTSVTDDTGGATLVSRYGYDANGNLTDQYDPRNNHVQHNYDELNRKISHIQHKADGNLVTAMGYDEEGNLTSLTDAMGQVVTYGFDELNRQTTASYPATATPYLTIRNIATEYDANNNVTTITETKDETGGGSVTDITSQTYDDFDRPKSSTQRGLTISSTYDANGNRTGVESPGGSTTYTFDNRNRLATAVTDGNTTSYSYTPDGKKKTISYPNGTSVAYGYAPTNRVENVVNVSGSTAISSYAYQYDSNGNRTQQVEVQSGTTETTTYSYNTLDQMTGFTVSGTTATTYTFEGYNRTTEKVTENGTITKDRIYSYDETDWLKTIVDNGANPHTIAYIYDNNGSTITKTDSSKPDADLSFTYDSRNQLVQTTRGPPASPELLGQYDYNAQGLRVRHLGSERGDVLYYYDDHAVLEEHRAADDSLLAHYRYADRLLSLTTESDSQFYHYDGLGSTVNLSDSVGGVQVSYLLDPWGNIISQVGESVNRQIFTGQEHDGKTGLIYFGARFYDPDIGRFINQDSYLGESGTPPSLHRYLYAYGNPTVFIDPDGHISNRQMWGIDDESVDKSLEEDSSLSNIAWLTAKSTGYTIWNGITGGFVSRQDDRQERYDRGEISDKEFWTGTGIDTSVSVGAQVVGGAVAGKVAGRVAGATGSKLAGNAFAGGVDSGVASVIEQGGQVATYKATDGRLGQESIDFKQVAINTGAGVVVGGGLHGVGQVVKKTASVISKNAPKITREIKSAATDTGKVLLAGKGGRLNPLNYRLEGLGSNLGNLKYKPGAGGTTKGVSDLAQAAAGDIQPFLKQIRGLDSNAKIGIRGSLARGTKGEGKNFAPFDRKDFDVDAFIISDELASFFSNRFRDVRKSKAMDDLGVLKTTNSIDKALRNNKVLKGLRDEPFSFRVFKQHEIEEFIRKGDPQLYIIP